MREDHVVIVGGGPVGLLNALGLARAGVRVTVLEREPAVPGHMVGVRVGLEHALEADTFPCGGCEQLLDCERRVDDDRHARLRVADEVRRAAEIFVHELPEEQHGPRR